MSTCRWCTPGGSDATDFLRQYASGSLLSKEEKAANEDLCYCLECVVEYHRAREELPSLHKCLWKLETSRLLDHFRKSLKEEVGEEDDLFIVEDDQEIQIHGITGPEFENNLRVPLLEILKYPYLLVHSKISELCVEALCRMEKSSSFQVFDKHSGIYLLLVHPDETVRKWAIRTARSLGKVDRDDFYDLQDVFSCMFKVIELDLFLNSDIYSSSVMEEGKLILLPPHLYDSTNYKDYWLGICMLLTVLDSQAMDSLLLGPDKQNDLMHSILNTMEKSAPDEGLDPFWPSLQCFMVILDRLGSKVWGQLIDPTQAFQTIIGSRSYNQEIENIRRNTTGPKIKVEPDQDENMVTCSQIVYDCNTKKQNKDTGSRSALSTEHCSIMYEEMQSLVNVLQSDMGQEMRVLVHPDETVRKWAIRTARSLGKVDRDDFYDLQDVFSCMFKVIELDLFLNSDIYSSSVMEEGKLILLPPHLYDSTNYKDYWLDEGLDPFWPALQCFMVILDRLGSKVWGQLIDPTQAFQTIIGSRSYNQEIENIRRNTTGHKIKVEPDQDENMVTCSQIVYDCNTKKQNKSVMDLKDLSIVYTGEIIHHLCAEIKDLINGRVQQCDKVTEFFILILVFVIELHRNKNCMNLLWFSSQKWVEVLVKCATLSSWTSSHSCSTRVSSTSSSMHPQVTNVVPQACIQLIRSLLREGCQLNPQSTCKQFLDKLNLQLRKGVMPGWDLSHLAIQDLQVCLRQLVKFMKDKKPALETGTGIRGEKVVMGEETSRLVGIEEGKESRSPFECKSGLSRPALSTGEKDGGPLCFQSNLNVKEERPWDDAYFAKPSGTIEVQDRVEDSNREPKIAQMLQIKKEKDLCTDVCGMDSNSVKRASDTKGSESKMEQNISSKLKPDLGRMQDLKSRLAKVFIDPSLIKKEKKDGSPGSKKKKFSHNVSKEKRMGFSLEPTEKKEMDAPECLKSFPVRIKQEKTETNKQLSIVRCFDTESGSDNEDDVPLMVIKSNLEKKRMFSKEVNQNPLTDSQVDRDLGLLSLTALSKSFNFPVDSSQESSVRQLPDRIERKVRSNVRNIQKAEEEDDLIILENPVIIIADLDSAKEDNDLYVGKNKVQQSAKPEPSDVKIAEKDLDRGSSPPLYNEYDSQLFEFETEDEVFSAWDDSQMDNALASPETEQECVESSKKRNSSLEKTPDLNDMYSDWGYDTDYVPDDVIEKAAEHAEKQLMREQEAVRVENTCEVSTPVFYGVKRKSSTDISSDMGSKSGRQPDENAMPATSSTPSLTLAQKLANKRQSCGNKVTSKISNFFTSPKAAQNERKATAAASSRSAAVSCKTTSPAIVPPRKVRQREEPKSTAEKLGLKKKARKAFDLSQRSLDCVAELRNYGQHLQVEKQKRRRKSKKWTQRDPVDMEIDEPGNEMHAVDSPSVESFRSGQADNIAAVCSAAAEILKSTSSKPKDDHLFLKPGMPLSLIKIAKPSTTKIYTPSSRSATLAQELDNPTKTPKAGLRNKVCTMLPPRKPSVPPPESRQPALPKQPAPICSYTHPSRDVSQVKRAPVDVRPMSSVVQQPPKNISSSQQYDLSFLIQQVLEWNHEMFENFSQFGTPNNLCTFPLKEVPEKFSSFDEYFATFYPLLMVNTFEELVQEWQKNMKSRKGIEKMLNLNGIEYRNRVSCASFSVPLHKSDVDRQQYPKEDDLVFLWLPQQVHAYTSEEREVMEPVAHFGCVSGSNVSAAGQNDSKAILYITIKTRGNVSAVHDQPVKCMVIGSLISTLRAFKALYSLRNNMMARAILGPHVSFFRPGQENKVANLSILEYNDEQQKAINSAIVMVKQPQRTPKICLIHGPPGTGKTKTIVGFLESIFSEFQQLTDEKCRLLREREQLGRQLKEQVLEWNHEMFENFSRFGTPNNLCTFPLKEVQEKFSSFDEYFATFYPLLMVNTFEEFQQLTDEKCRLLREREQLGRQLKETRSRKQEVQARVLQDAHVICCTLSTSGSILLESAFRRLGHDPFSCVIVDEAGQATEMETLIPLTYRCPALVLVGDPEQLPPTVISQKAREKRYDQSLMARLWKCLHRETKQNPGIQTPINFLSTQYRMHPDICEFPSKYIYKKALKTDGNTAEKRCGTSWPFQPYRLFDVTDGYETKAGESFHNDQEVKLVMQLIKLIAEKPKGRVGVITHYSAQKQRIKDCINREGSKLFPFVEVDTVDGFQGREKDCIIVSCVRASNTQGSIGFLGNRQRLNVTITRAKCSLFILGHLKTLMDHRDWGALIQDAHKRGTIIKTREKDYKTDAVQIFKPEPGLLRSFYPPVESRLLSKPVVVQTLATASNDKPVSRVLAPTLPASTNPTQVTRGRASDTQGSLLAQPPVPAKPPTSERPRDPRLSGRAKEEALKDTNQPSNNKATAKGPQPSASTTSHPSSIVSGANTSTSSYTARNTSSARPPPPSAYKNDQDYRHPSRNGEGSRSGSDDHRKDTQSSSGQHNRLPQKRPSNASCTHPLAKRKSQ
ncbi:UNVERIFIED_CONTAM: hypothetical protein FKN15_056362 [Acipenser sinensis]